MATMSLLVAIKDYFGFKPGQTMLEFRDEIKALTPEDREYFKRELEKVGYTIAQAVQ